MAVRRLKKNRSYGIDNPLQREAPLPIIVNRAPSTNDLAELGTTWIDSNANAVYVLVDVTAGSATWTTSPASGVGNFAAVTVNPGDIDVTAGDVNIDAGDLTVTAGNTTLGGDLTVTGVTTINGDLDLSSAALIDLTSTLDAAPSIYLHANGGVNEQILLRADQGTAVNSISLLSDVGGVTINGGIASADAVRIISSNAAGGIDIDSGTGGIALDSTAGFSIDGATASNVTVTGASQDLTLSASGGSVNITATEAAADAIVLNASNAAGGIDLLTGGGEISISSSGNVAMAPATATVASPTATAVINARVFKATFTGFTTAAAGTQDFTITNSAFAVGDGVIVTVSNAGTNDAKMTMTRVNGQTAGSLVISTTNNGAAALNGNVVITGWIVD